MAPISVICIPGPTGAGKTEASLHLARELGGGVVNFDSRQVYRDFPVITAQPSPGERAVCPHRLYGFLSTEHKIAAGAYADMAVQAAAELRDKGLVPIFVGGTGLYLKAMLEPLAPIPDIPDEVRRRIQEVCDRVGSPELHRRLEAVDGAYAGRIHPNDRQRVTRALEVYEATGKPISCWHAESGSGSVFRAVKLGVGLPLDELVPRLALRVDKMLEAGALDEARAAMAVNDDPSAPGWSGIGCAELLAHLRGELSLDEAKALWIRNTRAYAKRQLTWFRKDGEITWFRPGEHRDMLAPARAFLEEAGA